MHTCIPGQILHHITALGLKSHFCMQSAEFSLLFHMSFKMKTITFLQWVLFVTVNLMEWFLLPVNEVICLHFVALRYDNSKRTKNNCILKSCVHSLTQFDIMFPWFSSFCRVEAADLSACVCVAGHERRRSCALPQQRQTVGVHERRSRIGKRGSASR